MWKFFTRNIVGLRLKRRNSKSFGGQTLFERVTTCCSHHTHHCRQSKHHDWLFQEGGELEGAAGGCLARPEHLSLLLVRHLFDQPPLTSLSLSGWRSIRKQRAGEGARPLIAISHRTKIQDRTKYGNQLGRASRLQLLWLWVRIVLKYLLSS